MIKYAVFLFMAVVAGALTYFEFPGASSQGRVRLTPDANAPEVTKSNPAPSKVQSAQAADPEDAKKDRWIDRYLSRSDQQSEVDADGDQSAKRVERPEPESHSWKTYIRLEDGEIVEVDGRTDTYSYRADTKSRTQDTDSLNTDSRSANSPNTDSPSTDSQDTDSDSNSASSPRPTRPVVTNVTARGKTYQSRDKKFAISMDEAAQISQPDLRDRAYMSIVEYAADNGLYPEAEVATSKIGQIELRDTARSTIAVSMARRGESERAFEVINEVETPALKDVMRLQVIEATILPERRQVGMLNEPH